VGGQDGVQPRGMRAAVVVGVAAVDLVVVPIGRVR
jgi:hypothetical protein